MGLPIFHSLEASRKHTSVWSPSAPLAWLPSTGRSRNRWLKTFFFSLEQHWWSEFFNYKYPLTIYVITKRYSLQWVWGSKTKAKRCKIHIIKRKGESFSKFRFLVLYSSDLASVHIPVHTAVILKARFWDWSTSGLSRVGKWTRRTLCIDCSGSSQLEAFRVIVDRTEAQNASGLC